MGLDVRYNIKSLLVIFFLFLLVFVFYPSERKFRYEFQKGKPWQHDNLIAPFDFPVYKLDEEYKKEYDSINSQIKFYYIYDNQIGVQNVEAFGKAYRKNLRSLIKQDSIKNRYRRKINVKKYNFYYNKIKNTLEFIYNKGIFDPTEIADMMDKYKDYSLVIFKDNTVKNYALSQVFTLKKAYKYLNNNLLYLKQKYSNDQEIIDFFLSMHLENYIKPNLIYNHQKTMDIHNKLLSQISKTRGKIQAGELIISKGEIVTEDKYRILISLKKFYEASSVQGKIFIKIGNFILLLTFYLVLILFIYNYKVDILQNLSDTVFIFALTTFFIILYLMFIHFSEINIYILPIALLPIIIKVFFDERLALFAHLTAVFIIGFVAPNSFEFIIMQFVSGFAAIFALSQLSRRGQIYISVIAVFISFSFLYLGIALIQEGNLLQINWKMFLFFGINSLLLLLGYPLIYIFERLFNKISDITLIELLNSNHPLLYKLSTSAAGTFQHSLQVANLAEYIAKMIGANALLTRVGALYHDIGKTYAPHFFTENQHGINPHDNLEFEQSAKIIIDHVNKGIELANKYKLPQQIIDFIRTHHGTTTVQYFYKKFIKKYPDKQDELDKFRYPGPKPFSKETAIVMMADSIEAASRSLSEYTSETIDKLVDKIIDYQMKEHQYDDADITFKEINYIRKLFKEQLMNIYHRRIAYPK